MPTAQSACHSGVRCIGTCSPSRHRSSVDRCFVVSFRPSLRGPVCAFAERKAGADDDDHLSFPKNKIKILLLENCHPDGIKLLEAEGFQVEALKGALTEDELVEKIKDVHWLGVRSKTSVTAKVRIDSHPGLARALLRNWVWLQVIANARRLLGIGCFCIGTDQATRDR